MRRTLTILTFIAVAVLLGCTGRDGNSPVSRPSGSDARGKTPASVADTLYTQEKVLQIYGDNPERALELIDSAEIVGNISSVRAGFLRATVYGRSANQQRQDTAVIICETLMRHDSVRADVELRKKVLELLVNGSRIRYDDEQWLRWSVQLVDLFRQSDEETEALRTEAEIGVVMTHLGQYDEGLAKLNYVISRLESGGRFNELDASVIALKRKVNVLSTNGRYEDVISVAQHIIDRLTDYEAHPEKYHDGSHREPSDADRAGYIGFYKGQALAFITNAYANLYKRDQSGEALGKARHYLSVFNQTDYGKSLNGKSLIAPALGLLGDYGEMLEIYDEMEKKMIGEGDTLRDDYAEILLARAEAASALGNAAVSQAYWHRYDALRNRLNERLLSSEAHQYAARYHAQEQQMEIERQETQLARERLLLLLGAVIAAISIAFAVWFFRQKREVERKNRILARQVDSQIAYSEEPEQQEEPVPTMPKDTSDDASMFAFLSHFIEGEQLFLNPQFGRQTLIDRFHISKERVGSAFAQGSSYNSLLDYVNDCRLRYGARMLKDNPNMPVGDVAVSSGFANGNIFGRNFKQKYGITPTEYRASL